MVKKRKENEDERGHDDDDDDDIDGVCNPRPMEVEVIKHDVRCPMAHMASLSTGFDNRSQPKW